MTPQQRRTLDEVARDLDLLVYRLEAAERDPAASGDLNASREARGRLRRDLEALRDRLQDVVDDLW